jgi:hypothetical protein
MTRTVLWAAFVVALAAWLTLGAWIVRQIWMVHRDARGVTTTDTRRSEGS